MKNLFQDYGSLANKTQTPININNAHFNKGLSFKIIVTIPIYGR